MSSRSSANVALMTARSTSFVCASVCPPPIYRFADNPATGLERSKRYRSDDGGWVYQRKQVDAERARAAESSAPAIPIIQPTRDGDEERLLRHPHKPAQAPVSDNATTPEAVPAAPEAPEQPAPTASSHQIAERIRRFHLSRSNSPQPTGGVSKKRTAPAVFIERDAKKQRDTLKAILQERNAASKEPLNKPLDDSQSPQSPSPAEGEPAVTQQPTPVKKYKRPGTRVSATASNPKPTLPPSMRGRETSDVDDLAQAMDKWTLDLITKNLDNMEEQRGASKYSPAKSRFKPKAPAQRYFERHPQPPPAKEAGNTGQQVAASTSAMDVDVVIGDTTDEEDYVLETYQRVPVERLRDQAVPAHRVGLLVFDTEPDAAEFFYGNESDSEDDFPEDEDDENGGWSSAALLVFSDS